MKGLLKNVLMGAVITGGALILAVVSEHVTEEKTKTIADPETGETTEVVEEKTYIRFGKVDKERVKNLPKIVKKSIKRVVDKIVDYISLKSIDFAVFYEVHKKELTALKFGLSFIGVILGLALKMHKVHGEFCPPEFSIDRYSKYEKEMFKQMLLDGIAERGGMTYTSSDGLYNIVCKLETVEDAA